MAFCRDRAAPRLAGRGPSPSCLLGAGFGHKHGPSGLYERIFLALELLPVALTAVYIATRQLSANRFE